MACGHKQHIIDGPEYDYLSNYWRRMLCWSPGVKRYITRKLHKRDRVAARQEIRNAEG